MIKKKSVDNILFTFRIPPEKKESVKKKIFHVFFLMEICMSNEKNNQEIFILNFFFH